MIRPCLILRMVFARTSVRLMSTFTSATLWSYTKSSIFGECFDVILCSESTNLWVFFDSSFSPVAYSWRATILAHAPTMISIRETSKSRSAARVTSESTSLRALFTDSAAASRAVLR